MEDFKHLQELWDKRLQVQALEERYHEVRKFAKTLNRWYGHQCKARHAPSLTKGKEVIKLREKLKHDLEAIKQRLESIENNLKENGNADQREVA